MKKQVAVFQYVSGVLEGYQSVREPSNGGDSELARVSEYVEVEFPPLPREAVIGTQVMAINNAIEKARADHADNIQRLESRRAELLALPNDQ